MYLLSEPPRSSYDLEFAIFGFPVRVTWSHWLMGAVIGFSLVLAVEVALMEMAPPRYLLVPGCVGAVFLSILVHELGHAFAFRQFGIESAIVLYHFGGLAIPQGGSRLGFSVGQPKPLQDAWIAAAGPLAQLGLAAVVAGIAIATGDAQSWIDHIRWLVLNVGPISPPLGAEPVMIALVDFILWPSIVWAILNLVPVWPLDGGRIAQELIVLFGGTRRHGYVLSTIAAAAMVMWGLVSGQIFFVILFASLAVNNYQMLQSNFGSW